MAELLHYLDKMEYRPTPKPRAKVLLKKQRTDADQDTTVDAANALLEIIDKTGISGFKRTFIKEFERTIGVVQEKKRKEGETRTYQQIIVEPVFPAAEEYGEIPAIRASAEPLANKEETKEEGDGIDQVSSRILLEQEPKTPEDKSRELDEQMEAAAEEEPKTPEDKSRELQEQLDAADQYLEDEAQAREEEEEGEEAPGPKERAKERAKDQPEKEPGPKERAKKGRKKVEQEQLKIPKVRITETTEIEGEPVLSRVPREKDLSKLVVRAPTYYMANRKLYTTRIADLFKDFSKELLDEKSAVSCDRQGSTTNIDLLIHQRIVREYLNLYTPYRGLLLFHGLGSGKTCTSIAIAEAAKTHKRVFVMTPASLKMNFFSELKKCGDPLYKKNQFWEFISVEGRPEYVSILSQVLSIKVETVLKNGGAWLVDIKNQEPNYAELSPENQKSVDQQLNEMIRAKYVDINYNGLNRKKFDQLVATYADPITGNPFDHSVVLVDEAHNLVSRIVNNLGNKDSISYEMYNYLQSAQDVRVVFMTGTPIINYPNEMGILFNMLRGRINTWKFRIPSSGKKLTPESIVKMFQDADFRTYDYVDYSNDTLSITRNPFGFINTKKPGKAPANKAPAKAPANKAPANKGVQDVPRTIIRRGGNPEMDMTGGGSDSDTDSDSDSDYEEEKQEQPQKKRVSKKQKSPHKPMRRTKRNIPVIKQLAEEIQENREDEIIEHPDYKNFHGALVLRKDRPTHLSDAIKAEISREVDDAANGNGEDPYHGGSSFGLGLDQAGGAIVVDDRYHGVHLNEQGDLSDVDFVQRVKEILTENGISFLPEITVDPFKCLPDTQKEFTQLFVDMDSMTVQRPDVLKKRILGLSSYFRSAQESLLPSFVFSTNEYNKQFHVEYVEMSDHQFVDYAKERATEMAREKKTRQQSKAMQNKEVIKVSGTYRTFTRAKCNFSFPDEIPRPMPPGFDPTKDVRADNLDNMRDDNELDLADDESVIVDENYEKSIITTLEKLKTEQSKYLTPEALKTYSPKFAKILANVSDKENRGLHLVYSAFRTLEGVGVLKLILEANGFAEFKLKKTGDAWSIVETDKDPKKPRFVLYTGTETAEEKEIIRNIYNSNWGFVPGNITDQLKAIHENNYYGEVIKIIMITSSGAEGINLENTRFVHIVEPYWHMVRVDQVVGRARRICSHKNLPEELRTIKVFLYMSKFTDKQKFSGENVKIMDVDVSRIKKAPSGSKLGTLAITTDETLFEIAVIKDRLTKQLLKSVKESSVDCNVYDNSKEGLVCYTYGHATSNEFGAFPSYEEDQFVREGADVVLVNVKPKKIVINRVKYVHNPETAELYNYKEYKENKRAVLEGRLEMVNGKPTIAR